MGNSCDRNESQLEELLDAAMASYSEPEGLDAEAIAGRVLARIDGVSRRSPHRPGWSGAGEWMRAWLMAGSSRWRIAVPALAALLIVAGVFAWLDTRHGAPRPPAAVGHAEPQATQSAGEHSGIPMPPAANKQLQAESRSPVVGLVRHPPHRSSRPEMFPAPTPPSDQEQMLQEAASQSPDVAGRMAAEQRQLARKTAEPVAIAEIQIQPLESAENDQQPH
jgi:hypothetical protein